MKLTERFHDYLQQKEVGISCVNVLAVLHTCDIMASCVAC